MDLDAYVAGRMRSVECVGFYVVEFIQGGSGVVLGIQSQIHSAFGEFVQHVYSRLQVVDFVFQGKVSVGSKRGGIESGDEDGFGLVCRIGYDSVRPLYDRRPQAAFKQGFSQFFLTCFENIFGAERDIIDSAVRFDPYLEKFPFFSANYGFYSAAAW